MTSLDRKERKEHLAEGWDDIPDAQESLAAIVERDAVEMEDQLVEKQAKAESCNRRILQEMKRIDDERLAKELQCRDDALLARELSRTRLTSPLPDVSCVQGLEGVSSSRPIEDPLADRARQVSRQRKKATKIKPPLPQPEDGDCKSASLSVPSPTFLCTCSSPMCPMKSPCFTRFLKTLVPSKVHD